MTMHPAQITRALTEIDALKHSAPEAWEDGEEQLLADMLQGSTTLNEVLAVIEDQRQDAAMMAGAIAQRIAGMEERKRRYARKEQAMRAVALKLMEAAGVRKVTLPNATLWIGHGTQAVRITDEDAIPDSFFVTSWRVDKGALKDALKEGRVIEGAYLTNGEPSLSVKVV